MDDKWVEKEKAWIEIGNKHLEIERETLKLEKDRLEAQQEANKLAELSAALEVMKLVGHHKHDDNNFGYRCNSCGVELDYAQQIHPHENDPDANKRAISYVLCLRCGFKDYERYRLSSVKNSAAVVILNHKFKSTQIVENNVKQ